MNVRTSLPIACAMGVFAIFSSQVQAAEPTQEITITGTRVERIPYDFSHTFPRARSRSRQPFPRTSTCSP